METIKTRVIAPVSSQDNFKTHLDEPVVIFEEKAGDAFGDCVIERPIGMGGAAAVYLARHTKLDTFRALKILKTEHVGQIKLRARFVREAKIAARLNNPGIAHIYDVGEQAGKPYIEMEFIDGRSLRSWLKERRVFPSKVAIAIAKQIADVLAYAHEFEWEAGAKQGIIHRDIKPENIIIRPDGRICVVDFGIARPTEWEGETLQGTILGTCGYMSIEQIDGREVDARSDLYSLCVVLYEMLGGCLPFAGDTYMSLMKNIASHALIPLRRANGSVSRELEAMVHRGLANAKEERFQSALVFLESLRGLKSDSNLSPQKVVFLWMQSADAFADESKKSKKWVWLLVGGLLLVLGFLNFQKVFNLSKAEKPVPVRVVPVVLPDSGTFGSSGEEDLTAAHHDTLEVTERKIPEMVPASKPLKRNTPLANIKDSSYLEKGKSAFLREDYFRAEPLLESAKGDSGSYEEANYLLLRIQDAKYREGKTELKSKLVSNWQIYIRENEKQLNAHDRIKDAKIRLLRLLE